MRLGAVLAVFAAGALLVPSAFAGRALEPVNGSKVTTTRPAFVVSVSGGDRFPQIQVSAQSGTTALGFPLTARLGICLPASGSGRSSCQLPYDLKPGTYYWLLVFQTAGGKVKISGPLRFTITEGGPEPAPPTQPPASDLPPVEGPPSPTGSLPRPPEGGDFAYETAEAAPFAGERAVVHYVTSGLDAPPLNDDDGSGVPDYVEQVAAAADTALAYYAARGYKLPLPDSGGSDARPDVYLSHFDHPDLYGVAIAPVAGAGGSFVVLSSRLDQSPKLARGSLAGTAAHELFHVVQYAYVPDGTMPDWVAEGTASALALSVFPKIADLVAVEYLDLWLREPWRSLYDQRFSCDRCYGGAWWWMFLEEGDPELLPAYFARLRRYREDGKGLRSGIRPLDEALRGRRLGTIAAAFTAFSVELYRAGLSPSPTTVLRASREKQRGWARRLNGLSTHYIPIAVPSGAGGLELTLSAGPGLRPQAAVILGGPKGRRVSLHAGTTSIRFRSAKERKRVLLVVTNGRQAHSRYRVSLRAL